MIRTTSTDQPTLCLRDAQCLIAAAVATAEEIGSRQTITVVDAIGDRIAEVRMDGASRDTGELACAKAFTACTFDLETEQLAYVEHPARAIFDEPATDWEIIAGGVPLHRDHAVIGAVGVTGGEATQDQRCAKAAAAAWVQSAAQWSTPQ